MDDQIIRVSLSEGNDFSAELIILRAQERMAQRLLFDEINEENLERISKEQEDLAFVGDISDSSH